MEKKLDINQALNFALEKQKQGKLHEAEIIYKKILEINPSNSNALHLSGLIAYQLGNYEEAVNLIKNAIQLKPNTALYYGNLGMAYDKLEKEEDSINSFEKALALDPYYPNSHLAHYNLAVSLTDRGKFIEALEHYNKAIEIDRDFFDAHWNKSHILLLLGRFEEGWKEYEYRFRKKSPVDSRVFNKPQWDGSSLEGKKILILSEQGFGDNIQFSRYIPLVKQKGAYVILECKEELKELFETLQGVDELIIRKGEAPTLDFDFYIHLMSLPIIFNTKEDNIPHNIPYLKPPQELVKKFKSQMNSKNFKIGIAWAGNPNQENDKNRSTSLKKFKILSEMPNVVLFSLQKGEASSQLNDNKIINMEKDMKDFSDTAAIIENLDLIISVDTSIAHLAGAIGKPVWVLLSYIPDWRWLLGKRNNSWYPTMKLFRQKKAGDWDSLFMEVVDELKNLMRLN